MGKRCCSRSTEKRQECELKRACVTLDSVCRVGRILKPREVLVEPFLVPAVPQALKTILSRVDGRIARDTSVSVATAELFQLSSSFVAGAAREGTEGAASSDRPQSRRRDRADTVRNGKCTAKENRDRSKSCGLTGTVRCIRSKLAPVSESRFRGTDEPQMELEAG